MTREEAEKELEKRRNPQAIKSLGFCPLIKTQCRVDCVCYQPARIYSRETSRKVTYWDIIDEACTSPMLSAQEY